MVVVVVVVVLDSTFICVYGHDEEVMQPVQCATHFDGDRTYRMTPGVPATSLSALHGGQPQTITSETMKSSSSSRPSPPTRSSSITMKACRPLVPLGRHVRRAENFSAVGRGVPHTTSMMPTRTCASRASSNSNFVNSSRMCLRKYPMKRWSVCSQSKLQSSPAPRECQAPGPNVQNLCTGVGWRSVHFTDMEHNRCEAEPNRKLAQLLSPTSPGETRA